jgi:hypothetical protein
LAEKHGVPLVLDASWFNSQGWSEVSHFLKLPLKAKVVRRCSIGARALRKFTGKHYWDFGGFPTLREDPADQSFASQFLSAPNNCLLFGYFQSPLYFEGISASLRSELNSLIGDALNVPRPISLELEAPNSVAVHVRRKDYLDLPVFQVCDETYYRTSMDRIRSRLPQARFHIFSDDPEWCRSTFQKADEVVVDSGDAGTNPLYDMHLMSLASHHIIANSSYSWWAAWLGQKPGQQVLMPDRWYAHGIKAPIAEKRLVNWEIVSSISP